VYPDKVYFQYTDLDRDEPDLQQNCAISYEQAADLWQQLRAAWMTKAAREFVHCRIEEVQEDDFFEGWQVKAKFIDMETTTLHLDNYGKLVCPNGTLLEVTRTIQ
jgi:hypothetical protein